MDNFLQSFREFKGKKRLARILYRNKIGQATDVTIAGRYQCFYLLPNLKENVGFDIFVNGVYENETIVFLKKIIPAEGVLLDLGANIGAISIPLAKLRKDISIVGVEAAPWIFAYLERNVLLNNVKNIRLVNKALFDKDDVSIQFFSPQDKFGKGSLSPVFSSEGVMVLTKKVDSIVTDLAISKVDAIKIDVEGFEHFVFNGARRILEVPDAPDIVFEFVDWAEEKAMGLVPGAAQELLIELGYRLFLLEGSEPVPLDTVMRKGSCNLFASKKAKFIK